MDSLFSLGKICATPGAVEAFRAVDNAKGGKIGLRLLALHVTGDPGDLDAEDVRANRQALIHGSRIFSAYTLPTGVKVWVITEADRSVTTLMLPEEY